MGRKEKIYFLSRIKIILHKPASRMTCRLCTNKRKQCTHCLYNSATALPYSLAGFEGHMTSPEYPDVYPPFLDCRWVVDFRNASYGTRYTRKLEIKNLVVNLPSVFTGTRLEIRSKNFSLIRMRDFELGYASTRRKIGELKCKVKRYNYDPAITGGSGFAFIPGFI